MTFFCCRCGAPFTPPLFERAIESCTERLFDLGREHLCEDCMTDAFADSVFCVGRYGKIAACLEEHETWCDDEMT